jgi:formylglycine-generating enzyme required for sulfatase activity
MPTLFISYKRGTTAVAPLMEHLKQAHYRLWFDRDDIHLGDPDWQARIDQGLTRCDGVILNITPAACESEPVRYEVRKARELGKPIFPLVLERIASYDDAIRDLGLPEKTHIEDFTDVTRWAEQVERLLRDLAKQGLPVTIHEERQRPSPDNPKYVLHQQYLKRLVERIGGLNLAQIGGLSAGGVDLEQVYVDSPTPLNISVEVKDWQVIDWWLSDGESRWARELPRIRPESLGYAAEPLNALISQIDARIGEYRAENPEAKPDSRDNYSWNNGPHLDVLNLHLNHLAAANDRLVILGAPGSGKSTFVRYLALCLAGEGIDGWTRPVGLDSLDNWPHGALTPIYIELRRFVASAHFPADTKTPATADHLWRYIVTEVLGEPLKGYADDLQYDLEHGHALLILDGLDEVPYPEGQLKARQAHLIGLAQSLNGRYAGSRVLVASRPYAYEGWKLPGFESITITAFADNHRIDLARRLYQAAGLPAEEAEAKAQALNEQLESIDPELKDRPLFVTLMASIFLKNQQGAGLPTRRGALYRESILLLLDRWTTAKADSPSLVELLGEHSPDDLLARLAALAYEVQATYGEQPGTPEIDEATLYKHLKPLGRKVTADLIPYLSENAGVLVSPGQNAERDVFHFAHRTFQEYLAAVQLVSECSADSYEPIRAAIIGKPALWRVPCTLAGDVLADTGRRADLWNLLDDLLDDDVPEAVRADDPRWWSLWLAATVALEQDLCVIDPAQLRKGEKAIRQTLIDWLLKLIETPQALLPPERAACGRALSLLGDPRPGVGLLPPSPAVFGAGEGPGVRPLVPPLQRPDSYIASVSQPARVAPERGLRPQEVPVGGGEVPGLGLRLPHIRWADPIPAGTYWIGADDNKNNPRRQITIDQPYRVAKYLVTQAQYLAFQHDASERGYTCLDWWQGLAATDKEKRPAQPEFPYANHPMERVNWYQAVAFSRWLTWHYREAGLIAPEEAIRLPHEYEWEVAARGVDERIYSYPGEFDATKCNAGDTGIGQTSAVGLFPDGESPCRALDMTGNVWEWCLNRYEDGSRGLNGTHVRVLRGGSLGLTITSGLRSPFRIRNVPGNEDNDGGFRFARSSRSVAEG